MKNLVELIRVRAKTPEGRVLFDDLSLCLSRESAALVGRNGVGKSALLALAAGEAVPDRGTATLRARPLFVPQTLGSDWEPAATLRRLLETARSRSTLDKELAAAGLRSSEEYEGRAGASHGERRKLALLLGKLARPELLLLDEPTQDLDERGAAWLMGWLSNWDGGLLVASHDPRLLAGFEQFLVMAESGCRVFSGAFSALNEELAREFSAGQARYVRNLNRLIATEEHIEHIGRRRARKRRYGRISELGRATPRMRLNQKRDYAQVKHGKMKRMRDSRLAAARDWTKATRRALKVELGLALPAPALPPDDGRAVIVLSGVSAEAEGRRLFERLDLRLGRTRLAVTGPNGAGKTTLLEIMLGQRAPSRGSVATDRARVGAIAQGGSDWLLEQSLVEQLSLLCPGSAPEEIAMTLVAHKFPLALARRSLRTLSPGERVRAAMICLFKRAPAPELLVLDEPTYCLDLVGQAALAAALAAWPGGLVIASHNPGFLAQIGVERTLELGS
jgi:ATPase subunit of ABC transporter with duplicated ATPase domains